jgi:hypothetical protein
MAYAAASKVVQSTAAITDIFLASAAITRHIFLASAAASKGFQATAVIIDDFLATAAIIFLAYAGASKDF